MTLFIFFVTTTRTAYSYIINIYSIYSITDIPIYSRQGAIHIISIYSIILIINIYLL